MKLELFDVKKTHLSHKIYKKKAQVIFLSIVLADPSAPSMGSTPAIHDNHSDPNLHRSQSPVTRENSYPPSPSTSTGYNYQNTRSTTTLSDNQLPQQQYQPIIPPTTPKHQQPISPSPPFQQRNFLFMRSNPCH